MPTDKQVAEAWLVSLFGAGPPGQIGLWLRDEDTDAKRTVLLNAPADIHELAPELVPKPRENVYYRVSLLEPDFVPPFPGSRGKLEDTGAVVAFIADFDIAADDRGKKALPPDFETVMAIIDAHKFRPSRLIDSGRGVHAYWLFSSVIELTNKTEIANAAKAAELFHRAVVLPAVKEVGAYSVDSVFDLPRVLRLPGFQHIKTGRTVSEIGGKKGAAYGDLYDYDELVADVEQLAAQLKVQPKRRAGASVKVDWDLEREPQHFVIETLKKNTRFAQIIKNKATDLPSASEVDYAIANICLNLEQIADEEIARVLVWVRREMGVAPKRTTPGALVDYYKATIANAKERQGATERVGEVLQQVRDAKKPQAPAKKSPAPAQKPPAPVKKSESIETPKRAPDKPKETQAKPKKPLPVAERELAIQTLRTELGLPLSRVLKYHSINPLYELHFDDADIAVECKIDDIITAKNFQARVAAVTDKLIPPFSKKDWNQLAALLLEVVERADLDLTHKTQVEEWLNDYLENIPPATWDDRGNAYPRPFYMSERPARVAVSVANFATFIRRQGIGSITTGDIRIRMVQAEWKRELVDFPKLTKKKETKPDQQRYLWTFELTGFWRERALEAIEQRRARATRTSRTKSQAEPARA